MSLLSNFCSTDNFMPHGYCYLWTPSLVALHAVSDGMITLAYTIIPITLLYFMYRRKDLPFNWMFACFGLFIILCGSTHAMEIITLWQPFYWTSGILKAFTGIISILVAILLIRLIPLALSLPSQNMLQAANTEIQNLNQGLEKRIQKRTAALAAMNHELQQEIRERKKVEQSLRESEQRFRMLAEVVPQLIWTADPDGIEDYCNQRWHDYTGLSLEQTQQNWEQIIHPDDIERCLATWHHSFTTGEAYEIEYRLKNAKDNNYRWHLGRAMALKDQDGNIIKWFGTCTDIDDQKRAANELQSMHTILEERVIKRTIELQKANLAFQETMAELERSNQELAQFAYVASHDLQEPLRMVSSYTQLLERRYKDKLDEDANQFIHFAVDGAKRMQQLITALLDYSRVTTRTEQPIRVSCDSILQQALTNLQLAIEEGHVQITYSTLPNVLGDPIKLLQVFQNLLANAIKFRNPINPEIHIQADLKDDKWVFTIKDNGIGIEQEYFDKIFIIFQRLHGKQVYPGTGIGLSICKRVIEQHKGEIWVTSELGKGTTFYFTLPVQQALMLKART